MPFGDAIGTARQVLHSALLQDSQSLQIKGKGPTFWDVMPYEEYVRAWICSLQYFKARRDMPIMSNP
jgi:hypothetical protein